jgi:ankyrin repeat protein
MLALKGSSAPGSSETVVELLDNGADVGARNRWGSFALHLAAGCGASLATIGLLLRTGAAAHANAENEHGYTQMRAARVAGREDVVALLRGHGAPPAA